MSFIALNNNTNSNQKPFAERINADERPCLDRGAAARFETYFGDFFRFKLHELTAAMNQKGLRIEEFSIKGRVVPVILGLMQPPARFNDFDIQLKCAKNDLDDDSMDAAATTRAHQVSKKILHPTKFNFNCNLPYANYKLKPYSFKNNGEALVKCIDLSLLFKRAIDGGLPAKHEPDATSTWDGLKLIVRPDVLGQFQLSLTQSNWVTAYSSLEETLHYTEDKCFKVSLEHAASVRDGLLIYIRNELQHLTYIDETGRPGNIDTLYEVCAESFFKQYASKAQEMQLGDRLKTFIENHFPDNAEGTHAFLMRLTTIIQKNQNKQQAIQFLYNIQNCIKRLRHLNPDDQIDFDLKIEAAIQELSRVEPAPPPAPEDVPQKAAKPPYQLPQYIQDPNTLPGETREQKASCLARLLNKNQATSFDKQDLSILEQNLNAFLSELESNSENYLELAIAFLKFSNENPSQKALQLVVGGFANTLSQTTRKKNKKGKKKPLPLIENTSQTYAIFSPQLKEVLVSALFASSQLNVASLSEKNAAQLLEWAIQDCNAFSSLLWAKIEPVLEKIERNKQNKWQQKCLHKMDRETRLAYIQRKKIDPIPAQEEVTPSPPTPEPEAPQLSKSEQHRLAQIANINDCIKEARTYLTGKQWVPAFLAISQAKKVLDGLQTDGYRDKVKAQELKEMTVLIRQMLNKQIISRYESDPDMHRFIEMYEQYQKSTGFEWDYGVHKRLIVAYALTDQLHNSLLHTFKAMAILLKENCKHGTNGQEFLLLSNSVKSLKNALSNPGIGHLSLSRRLDTIHPPILSTNIAKNRASCLTTITELEQAFAGISPFTPLPVDRTALHQLAIPLVLESSKSCFYLLRKVLFIQPSDDVMLLLYKTKTQWNTGEPYISIYEMIRASGHQLFDFTNPRVYASIAEFFKERFLTGQHWHDLANSYLHTACGLYLLCNPENLGPQSSRDLLLKSLLQLFASLKMLKEDGMLPIPLSPKINTVYRKDYRTEPHLRGQWGAALTDLDNFLHTHPRSAFPNFLPDGDAALLAPVEKIQHLIKNTQLLVEQEKWLDALQNLNTIRLELLPKAPELAEEVRESMDDLLDDLSLAVNNFLNDPTLVFNDKLQLFIKYHRLNGRCLSPDAYEQFQHQCDAYGEWTLGIYCSFKYLESYLEMPHTEIAAAFDLTNQANYIVRCNRSIQESSRWSQSVKERIALITNAYHHQAIWALTEQTHSPVLREAITELTPIVCAENPIPRPSLSLQEIGEDDPTLSLSPDLDISARAHLLFLLGMHFQQAKDPKMAFHCLKKAGETHLSLPVIAAMAVIASLAGYRAEFIQFYSEVKQERYHLESMSHPSLLIIISRLLLQHYESSQKLEDLCASYLHIIRAIFQYAHAENFIITPEEEIPFHQLFEEIVDRFKTIAPELKESHPALLKVILQLKLVTHTLNERGKWTLLGDMQQLEHFLFGSAETLAAHASALILRQEQKEEEPD